MNRNTVGVLFLQIMMASMAIVASFFFGGYVIACFDLGSTQCSQWEYCSDEDCEGHHICIRYGKQVIELHNKFICDSSPPGGIPAGAGFEQCDYSGEQDVCRRYTGCKENSWLPCGDDTNKCVPNATTSTFYYTRPVFSGSSCP